MDDQVVSSAAGTVFAVAVVLRVFLFVFYALAIWGVSWLLAAGFDLPRLTLLQSAGISAALGIVTGVLRAVFRH